MDAIPVFSVVIPSHNGRDRLALTLDSIAASDFDLARLEVIVVDDASTDGTVEAFRDRIYPYRFSLRRGEYSNQSAATNEAIRHASGTYVLSTAQDILFHRDLLSRHLAWHEQFAGEDVAVLGYLPYPPNLTVTPFMSYLVQGGFQFAYWMIKDPLNVPPAFLYAPNFSVRREVLARVGSFDPGFPYGCQDSDLGIRLAEQGVRIVYEARAIGYHNHPVELREYVRRQERVGAGLVRLEAKHPDHEGGPVVWDSVIRGYLMYSATELDRDLDTVARLEKSLGESGTRYRKLWNEAFCEATPVDRFSACDQRTLQTAEALFNAYNRVLSFHWWKGYFAEYARARGIESVARVVRARVGRSQPSMQLRRIAESRLREHGIEIALSTPRDFRTSVVVHALDDYGSAARWLERFLTAPDPPRNHQVLLVIARDAISGSEVTKLSEVAEVVPCDGLDEGILEALGRSFADTVVVTSARVEPAHPRYRLLAETCFARFPDLAVLGGNVVDGAPRRRRYGFRFDGSALVETENGSRKPSSNRGPVPVDVAIPEFLIVRRAVAERLLAERASGSGETRPWNFELCGVAARARQRVLGLPELAVS
ncbi:MAG: glycosyltransferase [Acidobacteriia bacterium]|nr:glycosyltransferase [Terriglobia bacterium]